MHPHVFSVIVRALLFVLILGLASASWPASSFAQVEAVEDVNEIQGYEAGFFQVATNFDGLMADEPSGPVVLYSLLIDFEDKDAAQDFFELASTGHATDPDYVDVEPREDLGDEVNAAKTEPDDQGYVGDFLMVREDDVIFVIVVSSGDESGEELAYDVMDLMLSREPSGSPINIDEDGVVTGSWVAVFPTDKDSDILMGLEPGEVFDLDSLDEEAEASSTP